MSAPQAMFYVLLLFVGLAALAVYVLVVFTAVPGAWADRWGELEELPDNLGQWSPDPESSAGMDAEARGLLREVRTWLYPATGLFARERLVLQARYRDKDTGEIHSVEEEVALRRRRIKPQR